MTSIDTVIAELVRYALERELIKKEDEAYATARLMHILRRDDFAPCELPDAERPLAAILDDAKEYAFATGIIPESSVAYTDLFDTELMGALVPMPSSVIEKFYRLYDEEGPVAATDYFYKLACDSNYIRRDRIARDMKWTVNSPFGEIDITVNLSKPEKDPKAIAAAKLLPQSGYPKCALCHENEGYAGNLSRAPRQNLRQIPFDMAGAPWYLQYSPYVYYNEHCIALSREHTPMKIDRTSFEKLLGFVERFPHYFIGSNADLPIVGGSILSHDHMQGGRYTFAMEKAPDEIALSFPAHPTVEAAIISWPLAVIRLRAEKKEDIVELADEILTAWRAWSDPKADVFAETDGEPHNTITPIARRRGELFELDLALRNNRTSNEHPLGIFHPHAEHHNIKKENIGLIEVMGLAVLPSRLKGELALMCDAIKSGTPFTDIPEIEKHADWFARIASRREVNADNAKEVLTEEIGRTFVSVLSDAGVYKTTPEGREAFMRFITYAGGEKK